MWIKVETQKSRLDHPMRLRRQAEQQRQRELQARCQMSLSLAYWLTMGLIIVTAVFLRAAGIM